MKPSSIIFAGANAAIAALPVTSQALITDLDAQNAAWGAAHYPFPIPAALVAARAALAADPLASAAMSLRILGNEAWAAERKSST